MIKNRKSILYYAASAAMLIGGAVLTARGGYLDMCYNLTADVESSPEKIVAIRHENNRLKVYNNVEMVQEGESNS